MNDYENLNHTKLGMQVPHRLHPKYRRKTLYSTLAKHLGPVFRKLAEQKDSRVEEGHIMRDHVHMMLSIPPKYAVSHIVGYIKGKSAIHVARTYEGRQRNYVGHHFWGLLGARVLRLDGRGGFMVWLRRDVASSGSTLFGNRSFDSKPKRRLRPSPYLCASPPQWPTAAFTPRTQVKPPALADKKRYDHRHGKAGQNAQDLRRILESRRIRFALDPRSPDQARLRVR
jgi:putative transposase